VIRNCFTSLLILALAGWSIYSFWQVYQLKQENAALVAANAALSREVAKHKGVHASHQHSFHRTAPVDPVQDAQAHMTKAETAIAQGNIGVALSECRLAGTEIQTASSSTSSDVRANVAKLKEKLNLIQQQTTNLWQKLGV